MIIIWCLLSHRRPTEPPRTNSGFFGNISLQVSVPMAVSSSSSSVHLFLLLFLTATMEARPSPKKDEAQVLRSLFGSHLSSLILATPTSDDIIEGSDGRPSSSSVFAPPTGATSGLAGRRALPRLFRDFLRRQSKTRRRSRNSMVGGRGCFGMKMDRIGSISGLGC
ncbi:C-type natriuretic peptide 2 [Brachionichthys hirsutus]|uniref:C-type natriuretic peptide 2 n=1 Tax=Brachionichthys hirsutus TaxID=412623 RepID=UPI0036047300